MKKSEEKVKSLFLLLVLTLLTSCASSKKNRLQVEQLQNLVPKRVSLNVSPHFQKENECGANALFMAMQSLKDIDYNEILKYSFTKKTKGTYTKDMISTGRRLGFAVYKVRLKELVKALKEGIPVVSFHNYSLSIRPQYHYNLVVGIDPEAERFYVHDGQSAYEDMTYKRFLNTWNRAGSWSYVYVLPANIPSFVNERAVIENILTLKRIGRLSESKDLLISYIKKWPRSYKGYIALANLSLEKGDVGMAKEILKNSLLKVTRKEPIIHNLEVLKNAKI